MAAQGTEGTASPLLIRLFGPFEVRLHGEPLPRPRTRKGCWLLALLALHPGRRLDRQWLAGSLWPDSPESQALYNLRRTLSDLRRVLGPQADRLQAEPGHCLSLDLAGADVDVVVFDEAVARGDEPALEAAVRLHRGPLLEGCPEEWALQERDSRQHGYLAALERLAGAAAARSDHTTAAGFLRQAVAADPYREPSQRALMEALAAAGDTAAAILVYRELRLLLHRELNAEPSPETRALFERLRADVRRGSLRGGTLPKASNAATHTPIHPHSHTAMPGGNLPRPLSAFVGRAREVAEIGACLGSARLVTLTGTGGIGKTRLAIRTAEERAGEYADGAWFVVLAALADGALVPQAVARALRVPEAPGRPLTETLLEAVGARQLLLVLDNCEHVIDAGARLAEELLSGCPHLSILATSRQALGLAGETVWRVPSLEESEAVQLFLQRAVAVWPSFTLTPETAPAVAQVCRRLDGIPLAVELAAARLNLVTVEQVAARLNDRFRLLTGGSRSALPRQQTLQATLDWSYDLLSEQERALLRGLSVFAGGFTLEAAEAVCKDEGGRMKDERPEPGSLHPSSFRLHPSEDVLDLLAALVDKSLVAVEERHGEARCRLLETTREYARERLLETREGDEWRARHAQFFLALAERAEPELHGPAQAQWLQQLEEEHDNFRAALDLSEGGRRKAEGGRAPEGGRRKAEGGKDPGSEGSEGSDSAFRLPPSAFPEVALRMGGALGPFWWMCGYFSEGRERLQAILAQSGYDLGAPAPGREFRVARPVGNAGVPPRPEIRLAQAKALYYAGMLADDQGDYEAAGALFRESLALSRELGDAPGAAKALNGLGALARHGSDYRAARALYEESLAIWRELGDRWWTATSLANLARVALLEGEDASALGLVEHALAIQRKLQDPRAIARSLALMGRIAARLGEDERAQALHAESLALVRELGARMPIEETLQALGQVARDRGDRETALACYEERLTIAREMGSAWGVADSLYYLGVLAREAGEGSRAGPLWAESLSIYQRLGDHQGIAACLEALGGE